MSTLSRVQTNPYVGPRAFQTGEMLYGRDLEVAQLLDLLIAERIVLLYSPSGAGKTSLIQAGLIPELLDEDFDVLPVMRVSLEPPADADLPATTNRYVLSLLLSLEEGRPPEEQLPLAELASLDLATYLDRRQAESDTPTNTVLIFDQFEEILTLNPLDLAVKEAFFNQVASALRDQRRWALFAIREDYLARLDPYARLLPTRFSTTYRLDLLVKDTALLAIQEPARASGVNFTDAAAGKLVDDLRRVRVQRPDGATEEQPGLSIEPVQLQVVCRGLWEKLPPGATQVVEADVEAVGSVDSALAGYYARQVSAIAYQTRTGEKNVRAWFDQHLITEYGIRGQVLKEPGRSMGLRNEIIEALVDAHLVRAEKRRGATWYELVHDRFIEPIQDSNRQWRRKQLERLGRLGLVAVIGVILTMAIWGSFQQWRANSQKEVAISSRLASQATAALTDQLDLALLLNVEASYTNDTWETRSGLLAGLQQNPYLLTFLHTDLYTGTNPVYGVAISPDGRILASGEADGTIILWDLDTRQPITIPLAHHSGKVYGVAFSADGSRLASCGADGKVILWDVAARQLADEFVTNPVREVVSVAFSPDGARVASGYVDGTLGLWDVRAHQAITTLTTGSATAVRSVAFSPDGRSLASSNADGTIILWDADAGISHTSPVTGYLQSGSGVAFSPDGHTLAAAGCGEFGPEVTQTSDASLERLGYTQQSPAGEPGPKSEQPAGGIPCTQGKIVLLDISLSARGSPLLVKGALTGHADEILSVAFSPDGQTLASGSADRTVILWDVATRRPLEPSFVGHRGNVNSVAFGPDGKTLASGSNDGKVILWDAATRQLFGQRLGAPLAGHRETVFNVAFSPDGRTLASGSGDGTVILWDAATHQPLGPPLIGAASKVYAVTFSPDGQRLIAGNSDGTLTTWGLATPQPVSVTLQAHKYPVVSLAISPDGRWLASGSCSRLSDPENVDRCATGEIRLWDLESPETASTTFTGHIGYVYSLAFSPDGSLLASGGCGQQEPVSDGARCVEGEIRFWDVEAGRWLGSNSGHAGRVYGLSFSPDGQTLASAGCSRLDESGRCVEGEIRLWNIATTKFAGDHSQIFSISISPTGSPLVGHTNGIYSVAFSPDGRMLASGSADNTVILWDVATRQPLGKPFTGHGDAVRSVAFSPDGQVLASGSGDKTVIVWKVATREPVGQSLGRTLEGHGGSVRCAAFDPGSQILASGDYNGDIFLWDVGAGRLPGDPLNAKTGKVFSIAISPDGQTLASSGEQGIITVWDIATRAQKQQISTGHVNQVWSVAFSPDGKMLASSGCGAMATGTDAEVCSRGEVRLWNMETYQMIGQPFIGHTADVNSVSFSPDGKTIASGDRNGAVILWDVARPEPIGVSSAGGNGQVNTVAFSPDGRMLASSYSDGAIVLRNAANLAPVGEPLVGHRADVYSIAFSPDGRTLASGSRDNTVILWDVAARQPLGKPFTHANEVWVVAFSPDGKTLASGGRDNALILWDVSLASWQQRACRIANRNLKASEWGQFIGTGVPYRQTCPNVPFVR